MASFIILCYLAIINTIGELNVADLSSEFSGIVGIFVASIWSRTRSAFLQVGGDLGGPCYGVLYGWRRTLSSPIQGEEFCVENGVEVDCVRACVWYRYWILPLCVASK